MASHRCETTGRYVYVQINIVRLEKRKQGLRNWIQIHANTQMETATSTLTILTLHVTW